MTRIGRPYPIAIFICCAIISGGQTQYYVVDPTCTKGYIGQFTSGKIFYCCISSNTLTCKTLTSTFSIDSVLFSLTFSAQPNPYLLPNDNFGVTSGSQFEILDSSGVLVGGPIGLYTGTNTINIQPTLTWFAIINCYSGNCHCMTYDFTGRLLTNPESIAAGSNVLLTTGNLGTIYYNQFIGMIAAIFDIYGNQLSSNWVLYSFSNYELWGAPNGNFGFFGCCGEQVREYSLAGLQRLITLPSSPSGVIVFQDGNIALSTIKSGTLSIEVVNLTASTLTSSIIISNEAQNSAYWYTNLANGKTLILVSGTPGLTLTEIDSSGTIISSPSGAASTTASAINITALITSLSTSLSVGIPLGCGLVSIGSPSSSSSLSRPLYLNMYLYLRYLQIDYPLLLIRAFQGSSVAGTYDFLFPNSWRESATQYESPFRYSQYGISGLFIVNFWTRMITLVTAGAFSVGCKFLQKNQNIIKHPKLLKALAIVGDVFVWNFLVNMFIASSAEGYFDMIIEFQTLNLQNLSPVVLASSWCNSIFALTTIYLWSVLIIPRTDKIRRQLKGEYSEEVHLKPKLQRFKFLYADFKLKSKLEIYYLLIYANRLLVFNLIVTLLYSYPIMQVVLIMALNIGMIVYLVKIKPFRKTDKTIENIYYESILLTVNILVVVIACKADGKSTTSYICGVTVLYLYFIFVVSSSILTLYDLGRVVYRAIIEQRARSKVQPKDDKNDSIIMEKISIHNLDEFNSKPEGPETKIIETSLGTNVDPISSPSNHEENPLRVQEKESEFLQAKENEFQKLKYEKRATLKKTRQAKKANNYQIFQILQYVRIQKNIK